MIKASFQFVEMKPIEKVVNMAVVSTENKKAWPKESPLQELTEKQDGLLLLEFRQYRWDDWVELCKEVGYKPEIEE